MATTDRFPKLEDIKRITSLTTTAQTVFAASERHWFKGIHLLGGAADEIVIFRAVDNSPEFFRLPIAAGVAAYYEIAGESGAEGLEVVTASAAGDVTVAVFEVKPT